MLFIGFISTVTISFLSFLQYVNSYNLICNNTTVSKKEHFDILKENDTFDSGIQIRKRITEFRENIFRMYCNVKGNILE
jgi:hypothetical protein